MELPDSLVTVFSAELEKRDDTPAVEIPDRELTLGNLDAGETYRIAVFQRPAIETDSTPQSTPDRHRRQNNSSPPVAEGDHHEVEIEDVGEQGDGIARVGPGYIVFVEDTALGDRVTIEITQTKENFAFAEVVEGEPISR